MHDTWAGEYVGVSMAITLILWPEVGSAKHVVGSQLEYEQVDVASVKFSVVCVRLYRCLVFIKVIVSRLAKHAKHVWCLCTNLCTNPASVTVSFLFQHRCSLV